MLKVNKLSIEADYKDGKAKIVKDISFEVKKGEWLGIVGESGCGKTMMAMSILGLLPENCKASGDIYLEEENLLSMTKSESKDLRGKEIVLIPQSGSDFLNPVFKVKTQIYESIKRAGVYKKNEYKAVACELLRKVGFSNPEEVMDQYPFQLSGGMAQRVILAIGLLASPNVVIADEPTRGIDDDTAELFLKELESVFTDSAVIVITHNISVASICHKLLVMKDGKVMEYGDCKKIINNPENSYTKALLGALPSNGLNVEEYMEDEVSIC